MVQAPRQSIQKPFTSTRRQGVKTNHKVSEKKAPHKSENFEEKGKTRCLWLKPGHTLYRYYHDYEWGRPLHDDKEHFELLSLECVQAGLSWETVLNKREAYRLAFKGFDPKVVARFSKTKVQNLLKNKGLVRNRLKMESIIHNAKMFLKVQKEYGCFDKYIWKFVKNKPLTHAFKSLKDYPAHTPLSDTISKDLKARGFKFVGSTIVYAYMQSAGLVQDHSRSCYLGGRSLRRLKKKPLWNRSI